MSYIHHFEAITHADHAAAGQWTPVASPTTNPREAAKAHASQLTDARWEDDTLKLLLRCVCPYTPEPSPEAEIATLAAGQMWTLTVRRKTVYSLDTCREVKL